MPTKRREMKETEQNIITVDSAINLHYSSEMKDFKIAKVYWKDPSHYRYEDIKWLIKNACTTDFITVGHVLKLEEDIVLAHEVSEGRARDISVIPMCLVTKVKYLEVSDE